MKPIPWLSPDLYPFASHHLVLPEGRLHYLDEGAGDPILMLHGNPTWSFLYRDAVRGLRGHYRCLAPDYLGFGLSDKPADWTYRPQDHAACVARLLDSLDLRNTTLVVQDWGGPIGLSYVLDHPERIRALVLMNTWMWSVEGDPHFEKFSSLMGGHAGRFLTRRFHFFARVAMKKAFGDRGKLTPEVHRHYLAPQPRPEDRKGIWAFPEHIVQSSEWLGRLWDRRDRLGGLPALILWGRKDPAFRLQELRKWQELLPRATTVELADVGHYVQEELGGELPKQIDDFLRSLPPAGSSWQ